jgi:hypothetical protein
MDNRPFKVMTQEDEAIWYRVGGRLGFDIYEHITMSLAADAELMRDLEENNDRFAHARMSRVVPYAEGIAGIHARRAFIGLNPAFNGD